ncbi:xanthine dehydrogenase family protein molybdopterin-binding subunit [Amorphus orientalis]|uniref:Carbon-monoxide dehydrogenase large subunit n=1 Tax=Amorphus orientalis TaxID=649198 RepID=A0AAE3VRQ2_9HYPH|nr:xanthine dehydrogenase family protein molybdopterin-binding subunit [Amorphus orientalis]MDQ0317147.1 carbon-monoxide dehydrogenase large subunit [Amorphus orientalis]
MNEMTTAKFGIGAPARRMEDEAFITGHGHYIEDYQPEGALFACVVRSPIASGSFQITGGLDEARSQPGVHLVLTYPDIAHLGPLPSPGAGPQVDGSDTVVPERTVLCKDRVRFVGDPVAFVVAETRAAAEDAAELLEIDWEPEAAAADPAHALDADAPLVWPDHGSNLAFTYGHGDEASTEAAFARADKVAKLTLVNNRLVTNYMETRGCVAEYDAETGRYTLTVVSQGGHGMKRILAGSVFKIDPELIHVITPDVGGGFGTKIFLYPEYPLSMVAAEKLGRPVKWISSRSEAFLSDSQGRDNITTAELALDADGRFLGLKVDLIANMGAYLHQFGPFVPRGGTTMSPGVYDIPSAHVTVRGVYTNTVPLDAYRGAGRPEAAYVIERLVDEAARMTGMTPDAIRKLNFIPPEKMPYETATGRIYDSGEFAGHLDRAMELADWAGFEARAADSASRGKLRGIGLTCYIEACAFPGGETATVELGDDGIVTLLIGTQSNGQGHATAYSQVIADRLGIDFDQIKVIQGDTDRVKTGGGTGGSRSIPLGLPSVNLASGDLSDKIKAIAADNLEVAAEDLELVDGHVRIVGTDRQMSLSEVAKAAGDPSLLTASNRVEQDKPTFPNGTHICELEIDPDTGRVAIQRYTVVDDFGVTVNPILLAGQVYGGIVQGIGQALLENTVYDEEGQLLTASMLDYALPRADDVPFFQFETRNVPTTSNALGIKGAGEAGTVGSASAVMNAIVDALAREVGVTHVDMPATPAKLWSLIAEARKTAA